MIENNILELFDQWDVLSIEDQPKKRIFQEITSDNKPRMEHFDQFISLHQEWFICYFKLYHIVME